MPERAVQFQNKDKAFQELKIKLFMLKKQQNAEKLDDIRGKVTEIAWATRSVRISCSRIS